MSQKQEDKGYVTDEFIGKFVDSVNADESFQHHAHWFDGTILIEIGEERLWLKIYKGEVIDTEPRLPVFGYTFKITGPKKSWDKFLFDESTLNELFGFPWAFMYDVGGINEEIWREGNLLEAGRMAKATYILTDHVKENIEQ